MRADARVILTHTCPNAHSHAHCFQMVRLEEASTLGWGRARSLSPGKSSNDRVRPERLPDRLIRPLALVLILVSAVFWRSVPFTAAGKGVAVVVPPWMPSVLRTLAERTTAGSS